MRPALLEVPKDAPQPQASSRASADDVKKIPRNAEDDIQPLEDGSGQQDREHQGSEYQIKEDGEDKQDEDSESQAGEADLFKDVIEALDFDRLRAVALEARKTLCSSPHSDCSAKNHILHKLSCSVNPMPLMCSHNIVCVIEFSDGVNWVARIPGNGLDFEELDIKKMKTDYQTMRYIKASMSILLPQVFKWEKSAVSIGVSFASMSFIEGSPTSDRWLDQSWVTEEKRLKILTEIATTLYELSKFPFDRIGALEFADEGTVTGVGGMVWSDERHYYSTSSNSGVGWGVATMSGPYESAKDYHIDDLMEDYPSKRAKSVYRVMRLAIESIPEFMDIKRHCPLSPMDLNYQTIFVDDAANVVGFIDWDNVHTNPSAMGFARYPSWITRDWDPVNYGYSEDEDDAYESSPEDLSRYRQHYAAAFETLALAGYDPRHTRLSHIMEAIGIATVDSVAKGPSPQNCLNMRTVHLS